MAKTNSIWADANRHLCKADPVLASIIERVGDCTLSPGRDHFFALCRAICSQQISTAAARTVIGRFRDQFPRRTPRPELLLKLSDEQLQGAGLSRQKRGYIRDLAERFAGGQIPSRGFGRMTDEEIIDSLLPIKGVGRWTAEMFLIFVLNRPDLLPVDDLGLRKNAQTAYKLRVLPSPARLIKLAEPWRPWRSIATWYLWRNGDVPQ